MKRAIICGKGPRIPPLATILFTPDLSKNVSSLTVLNNLAYGKPCSRGTDYVHQFFDPEPELSDHPAGVYWIERRGVIKAPIDHGLEQEFDPLRGNAPQIGKIFCKTCLYCPDHMANGMRIIVAWNPDEDVSLMYLANPLLKLFP